MTPDGLRVAAEDHLVAAIRVPIQSAASEAAIGAGLALLAIYDLLNEPRLRTAGES